MTDQTQADNQKIQLPFPTNGRGKLDVTYRAPGELKARNRRTRKHPPEQIEKLEVLISTFGFLVPVLIDMMGFFICGHARVAAALRLGLDSIPVIVADHLSEKEARAVAIADNRMSELSSWDMEILRLEFNDFVELDLGGELEFDLGVIGFNTAEIDVMSFDVDGGTSEEVKLPDFDTPAVSKPGDIWQLRVHRIICGDATSPSVHEQLLEGKLARMVFTDPPYNVPVAGHVSSTGRHREFAMASGEMSASEFDGFLRQSLAAMRGSACDGAILMVAMDWRHLVQLIQAAEPVGLKLINLCIWNKNNGGMGSLYRSKHEEILVFKSGDAPHINNVQLGKFGRSRTNVWDYAGVNTFRRGRDKDLADHPTVKPTAMIADAIQDVTRHGDIVLDPFGGSGSTLLAAEKTGRRARLIEIDPLYVDVAIRRWQALTGLQAVHAETGELWDDRAAVVAAMAAQTATDAKEKTEADHG